MSIIFTIVLILSIIGNAYLLLRSIAKVDQPDTVHLPYVLHRGEILHADGNYYPMPIPELALLYQLPINSWRPANPGISKKEWKKYYGPFAIHLGPLPSGADYPKHLRALHEGILLKYPSIIVEKANTVPEIIVEHIAWNEYVENTQEECILNNKYLHKDTKVYAYDRSETQLDSNWFRVMTWPEQITLNGQPKWLYTFDRKLPKKTKYLKIAKFAEA